MRHGKKFNKLSRKSPHRKAMLANMACSLIEHKRINTTVAKAKALRQYVEPLITKSKTDSTHSRRVVFSKLRNKYAVTELFREVAPKIAEREGGYTRIIRTGNRLGDNAEMCLIELVDFNEIYQTEARPAKKSRRSRRGGKKGGGAAAETTTEAVEETTVAVEEAMAESEEAVAAAVGTTEETTTEAETTVEEPTVEEAPAEEPVAEEAAPEAEAPAAEEPVAEAATEEVPAEEEAPEASAEEASEEESGDAEADEEKKEE